jgi:hypothetical protein
MASLETIGGLHYEMMKRCYNENSVAYKDYGAKGIRVCDEWHDREVFRKWCLKNGWNKELRLERIDSKSNYCPENCKFGISRRTVKGSAHQKTKAIAKKRKNLKAFYGVPDNYSKLRIYCIYQGMHSRCERPSHPSYINYGARGIAVCDEWSGKCGFFEFYNWAMGNGYDEHLTIDRINNDLGYCPNNCRWVTMKEQGANKRPYKKKERKL